jgi:hypothetical protein
MVIRSVRDMALLGSRVWPDRDRFQERPLAPVLGARSGATQGS